MMKFYRQQKWLRAIAWFLIGLSLQCLLQVFTLAPGVAQTAPSPSSVSGGNCAALSAPLTPEEDGYARSAWQYFLNNYQPDTGFTNSVGGYPSGSLWDMGNYLTALNAARWLNLIPQSDFDARLNKFLTTLGGLKLFEDTLPNKVYHAANGQLVDYNNKPADRGLGWSALDLGRMLAAFHILRTCHPQYNDWLKGIVGKWQVAKAIKDGQLYGATVLPDGTTLSVQEGRLGYEEYAARGFELWGFQAPKAIALQPFTFVDVNGLQIPVDTRDYQHTNANNYVVSESYILDGIEFGLPAELGDYAARVLEAQKRRFEATGQLTAVSEDNLNGAPYFLYNTVYANGVAWAPITEKNEPYPQFRSISTKAAFGWRYLYPDSAYAKQVFEVVKTLRAPEGGYYAGLYEATKLPNKTLTGNTNGLILEILYYKARGNQPLIGASSVTFATAQTLGPTADEAPANAATASSNSEPNPPQTTIVAVDPIPSVGDPQTSNCPTLQSPLSATETANAKAAWSYFKTNFQAKTGLVSDRSDLKGTTAWGIGDYLAALHAARSLNLISTDEFDQRTRHLLGALNKLPLFAGELPNRGYNIQSLEPTDYGNNAMTDGTGWSALDVGRLLSALYTLKTCHPEYTNAVDQTVLDWSYLRVVRDGALSSAIVTKDGKGRSLTRVYLENRLGYEEYAARAFQLWGFETNQSAVGGSYQTATVDGVEVPIQRSRPGGNPTIKPYVVSDPFLLYGLEFGFDPQMRSLVEPILKAQAERYRKTGILTAAATTLLDRKPFIIHSTVISHGEPWATLGGDGTTATDDRVVSTAVAFAYHALFPNDAYALQLWQKTADLYDATKGYPEGFLEKTGKPVTGFGSGTNSLILQALLYSATQRQPLVHANSTVNSPWWQAIAAGDAGRGLPRLAIPRAKLITDASGTYWASGIPAGDATVVRSPPPASTPPPFAKPSLPSASSPPTRSTTPLPPLPLATHPAPPAPPASLAPPSPSPLTPTDQLAAKQAWKYFERNWNTQTGLVNAVDQMAWTTLWDQGSALLGIHAARQLGLITPERFNQRVTTLLKTLETLPIPATKLPNKAYSTSTAQMRQLDDTPDPGGTSGWSALDTARFLVGLYVLKTQYPELGDRINPIVSRWTLSKLVKNGWLYGGIPTSGHAIQIVQEGRLGYEQYAAQALKLWQLEATNALDRPPVKTVQVDGIPFQIDQRDLKTSGASNYLTSDPYVLWGLELGWTDAVKPQVQNLFKAQAQRFQRTGIVTAVNEDSLDRPPYFLYYSIYANGQPWQAINVRGKAFPSLRFLSTKAAFGWSALMPNDAYAKTLQTAAQTLADPNRGYFSGRYENPQLGKNASIDINTNAVILESLLYKTRGDRPLAF